MYGKYIIGHYYDTKDQKCQKLQQRNLKCSWFILIQFYAGALMILLFPLLGFGGLENFGLLRLTTGCSLD